MNNYNCGLLYYGSIYNNLKILEEEGYDRDTALLLLFLTYTPIIIIVSWILEITVDTPAKNWSAEIDIMARA